jgi:RimJ/RimL family protein N-acetyltransferase
MTDPIPLPPTPVLTTERLILRPLEAGDVDAVQRIFPQWELVKHLHAGVPWPYPDDGAAVNMAQCLEDRAMGRKFYWAITLKGSDELRGRIDLWAFDPERRDSRGFWLDPELWGRGLMTEAANAVTAYALETLDWPWLYLTNAASNRRSARVKEKQGATLAYTEPYDFVSGPDERQVWLLTREAWLARRGGGGA